ncbi:MAG: hypothetical protein EOP53_21420 [Sphingobacteriales bacterium]|nr:MAG: hypothetical protein EOP53_21420 [Sphingobacteriales bacterium]
MGTAISYLPFFAIGHAIAHITKYPEDGYSKPYQMMVFLAGMTYAFLGLLVLRKALLHFFADNIVAWVLLGVALGTNLYNYAAVDPGMSHSFFILSAYVGNLF